MEALEVMASGPSKVAHVLEYSSLDELSAARLSQIGDAFGEHGLGFLVVRGAPGYVAARRRLLPLIREFALLPEDVKQRYVREDLRYQFGWSHGKEVLENGKLDVAKGSFYANPGLVQAAEGSADAEDANLTARNNVWPSREVPALQAAFEDVSRVMVATAAKVARLCDAYLVRARGTAPGTALETVVRDSSAAKGRLLYYFPQPAPQPAQDSTKWCGWHCDHGSLTCLTKAMYFAPDGREVTNQVGDDLAIEVSDGSIVNVRIPEDCIAFQIGQAAQIHSAGMLRATPHCVSYPALAGVARATYALFLQPNPSCVLSVPRPATKEQMPPQFEPGMTFGRFAQATVDRTYTQQQRARM